MMEKTPFIISTAISRYHFAKLCKEPWEILGKDGFTHFGKEFVSLQRASSFKYSKSWFGSLGGLSDAASETKSANLVCAAGRRAS